LKHCNVPRSLPDLKGKHISQTSCGATFSAAISGKNLKEEKEEEEKKKNNKINNEKKEIKAIKHKHKTNKITKQT